MKKIIILTSLFLLAGMGCNKTTPPQDNGANEPTTDKKQMEEVKEIAIEDTFTEEEKQVGFKIHYPKFIPEGLTINKDNLYIVDQNGADKVIFYRLTTPGDEDKQIVIQEKKTRPTEEEVSQIENKTDLPELKDGLHIVSEYEGIKTNHILFSSEDGHMIQLSSKYFDLDTLIKIAKSME